MKEEKETTFGYTDLEIRLLEWDAVPGIAVEEGLEWQFEFEVAYKKPKDWEADIVVVELSCYLTNSPDDYIVKIKTRNVFAISKLKALRLAAGTLCHFFDYAIAHARAICKAKEQEDHLQLPVIPLRTVRQLIAMANKARHNSALLAFTDIYKLPLAEAYAARQRHKINLNAAQNIVLWFEPLPENHPRSIAEGATLAELVSTSSISFDYEHLTSTKWKIHLDIGLHILPIARIAVRSSFFVDGNDTDVFSMATLLPMYELAFKNMTERFKEKCDEHTIEFNRRIKNTINEKEMFVNGIIDSYFNFRKRDEVLNQKLLAQSFLELSPGINTLIVVNWVFIILDEVLFFNDAFDHEHNQRELATESIPQPIYHTIKHKFIELEKGNIKFNLFDSILFYLCLDIALQLIIGDNSDALLPALIEKGFTDDKQQKFIETGNDMFRNLQQTLVNSGSTISNLEERKDWNEIIK